jgi:hypothetical protein
MKGKIMPNLSKVLFWVCTFSAVVPATMAATYNVSLDTAPLVGHPAGPFSIFFVFTDGSGVGDANNTVTITNVAFGGGSALGNPTVFGGASGSLESGASITDSSFLNFIGEEFIAGTQLNFTLGLTLNADTGGIPDRLTFFIVDSSGVPLPTIAPAGDYFLGVDLGSSGPVFAAYASDPSRSPSAGNPVSIPAPAIVTEAPSVSAPVPSPSSISAGASTLVTVTAQIGDPTVIAGGVNLLQVNSTGGSPIILGVMQAAGNGTFTLQVTLKQATAGTLYLEVSAAFKGLLERVLSPIVPVSVTSGVLTADINPK